MIFGAIRGTMVVGTVGVPAPKRPGSFCDIKAVFAPGGAAALPARPGAGETRGGLECKKSTIAQKEVQIIPIQGIAFLEKLY